MPERVYSPLSVGAIVKAIEPFSISIDDSVAAALQRYLSILLHWNQKISLTTLKDPIEVVQRHFGESLFALSRVSVAVGRLADVGSGAGFPGLPLKIVCRDLQLTLVESNARKCAFLSEVVRALALEGVDVWRSRYESSPADPGSLDFITARAIGDYSRLLRWSLRVLRSGGRLLLWLGAEDAKALAMKKDWRWMDCVPIPMSKRRVLLIGQPLV